MRRSSRIADNLRKMVCPMCNLAPNDLMVACDKCNIWHHHECVGLTEVTAREISRWICKSCQVKMNQESSIMNKMAMGPSWASSTMVAAQHQTGSTNTSTRVSNLDVIENANGSSAENQIFQSKLNSLNNVKY